MKARTELFVMAIGSRGAALLGAAALAAALPGCAARSAEADAPDPVAAGYAFADSHCSGCHAVSAGGISPNPQSPAFEDVVNRPGVTYATLNPWLDNSHVYPDIMDFEIAPDQVDALARYMMTMQREDYRPLPQ